MSDVDLKGTRGDMPVVVRAPDGEGPHPGVVVISDALGMTSDLRNQVEWLAGAGFIAAAPDLYYWGGRLRCMFSTMREAASGEGEVFQDIETVRRHLLDRPDCSGQIGVIGFCMGGGFALLLAAGGAYQASSVNYGMVPKDALTRLADSCPVVASYGAKDPSLRGAAARLEEVFTGNDVPHDVHEYPDAGHSFLNDHADDERPFWVVVTGLFVRSEYHEPSAIDARRRIVEFFDRHLRD